MLSNVVPDITSDTINDYKRSFEFEDTEADSKKLVVKNAEISDNSTGRVGKVKEALGFSLNGTSKTLTFSALSSPLKVLYYTGFDTPYINYTDAKGNSFTEEIPADTSKEGYTHKYIFKNGIGEKSTITFSDGDKLTDDNNGAGYTLEGNENYCTTEYTVTAKIIGDADLSGIVNIKDATHLQKFIALLVSDEEIDKETADTDKDNSIDITDATRIQKYLAEIKDTDNVGEEIIRTSFNTQITSEKDDIIENPTFVPTNPQPPTDAPATTPTEPEIPTEKPITPQVTVNKVTFTNSLNWSGTISCYYWSDSNSSITSWPGVAMQKSGTNEYGQTLYTFTVPDGADKIYLHKRLQPDRGYLLQRRRSKILRYGHKERQQLQRCNLVTRHNIKGTESLIGFSPFLFYILLILLFHRIIQGDYRFAVTVSEYAVRRTPASSLY